MLSMTARGISLISPMRQSFFALSKASSFAADIIAKYSGTEPFPFSEQTLIYFNALRENLEEEKKLRDNVTYILKLTIIRKLILEGKLGVPSVTKLFLNSVSENIGHDLHYLRVSDGSTYLSTIRALSYINNTEDISEYIRFSEVTDGSKSYRCSSVDMRSLGERFFGKDGDRPAYSGTYIYDRLPAFVYKKEAVRDDALPARSAADSSPADLAAAGRAPQVLSDNVVNAIIAGTTAGEESYNYNNNELTYKNEASKTSGNAGNTQINSVSAPVTNITDSTTVVNTGDARYSRDNESPAFGTETSGTPGNAGNTQINSVSVPVTNITDSTTVVNAGDAYYSYDNESPAFGTETSGTPGNVGNTQINSVSAPVTNITDSTTVVNAGDAHYSYNNESLTYKTGNTADETGRERRENAADSVPTLAETIASAESGELKKAGELPRIELLVMNSFLSGGTKYLASVKEKYLHKHITLAPAAVPVIAPAAPALLNSPVSSFRAVSYAAGILTSDRELTPYERRIYDSAVSQVYAERHRYAAADTKQMFAGLDTNGRTKVLSLVVKMLESGVAAPESAKPVSDAKAPETQSAAQTSPAGHTTIRSVVKRFVDMFRGAPSAERVPAAVTPAEPAVVLPEPVTEKFTVTGPEMTLLKLLSEDKRGDIARLAGTLTDSADTVSSRLGMLYRSAGERRSAESIIADNIENAVYMPTVLGYHTVSPDSPRSSAGGTHLTQIFPRNVQNTRSSPELPVNIRNSPVYRTDLRNINNIQTQNDMFVSQDISSVQPAVSGARDIAVLHGSAELDTLSGSGEDRYTAPASVFRTGLYPGEIVKNVLEKIDKYEKSGNTAAARADTVKTQSPPMRPEPDRENASGEAPETRYAKIMQNYTFNNAVNEYSLPVTVLAESGAAESVRLLPVYALDGVILPEKPRDISVRSGRGLDLLTAPAERSRIALNRGMTVLRRDRMRLKSGMSADPGAAETLPGAETPFVQTDLAMPAETVLNYRDPGASVSQAARTASEANASQHQPDTDELIKKFGNLIEGGDAGLVPSYEIGKRGIGEAMAAIHQTEQKVDANRKLIEEIREKQRTIESETLKSSDMDAISDEMIRRLRNRMRLDRSRFAGQ